MEVKDKLKKELKNELTEEQDKKLRREIIDKRKINGKDKERNRGGISK